MEKSLKNLYVEISKLKLQNDSCGLKQNALVDEIITIIENSEFVKRFEKLNTVCGLMVKHIDKTIGDGQNCFIAECGKGMCGGFKTVDCCRCIAKYFYNEAEAVSEKKNEDVITVNLANDTPCGIFGLKDCPFGYDDCEECQEFLEENTIEDD